VQSFSLVGVMIFYVLVFGVMCLAVCDFEMDPVKERHPILCQLR
jgi:uncharacterized membrane protein YedE/YeeE